MLSNGERVVVESNTSIRPNVWSHVSGSATADGTVSCAQRGAARRGARASGQRGRDVFPMHAYHRARSRCVG
jgi:hypothetical protein